MDNPIFCNKFFLCMSDSKQEQHYSSIIEKNRTKYNMVIINFLLIITFICGGLLKYSEAEADTQMLKNINYILFSCYLIILMILKPNPNKKVATYLFFLCKFLLPFTLNNLRTAIALNDSLFMSNFLPSIYSLEILIKIAISLMGMSDFREDFVVELLSAISMLSIAIVQLKIEIIIFYLITSPFVLFLIHIITSTRKKNFYFNKNTNREQFWCNNILEGINSGFIQVKNDMILYMNQVMIKGLYRVKSVRKIIGQDISMTSKQEQTKSTVNADIMKKFYEKLTGQSENILNELLKDLSNSNADNSHNGRNSHYLKIKNELEKRTDIADCLPSCFCTEAINNSFFFIGSKTFFLNESEETVTYEIFCRLFRYPDDPQSDSSFELIFNDVTKTKLTEGLLAEEKYKSLIHSKIAHEFKNPLISINELVDQVVDYITKNPTPIRSTKEIFQETKFFSGNLRLKNKHKKIAYEILPQIKAMCNYLLIIIRDFAFFSKEYANTLQMETCSCDLGEILCLCEDIAIGLLKKLGKSSAVKFKIKNKKGLITKLSTDEAKLKQVLINLISNAVKFTNRGIVTLEVDIIKTHCLASQASEAEMEKYSLIFTVNDTGIGMKTDIKKGLGMKIIHVLTKMLGSEIEFKSELDKGSSFWFTIPVEVEREMDEEESAQVNKCKPRRKSSNRQISRNNTESIVPFVKREVLISAMPKKRKSLFLKLKSGDLNQIVLDDLNSSRDTVLLQNLILMNPLSTRNQPSNNIFFHFDDNSIPNVITINNDSFSDSLASSSVSSEDCSSTSSYFIESNCDESPNSKLSIHEFDTYNIIIVDDEKFVRLAIKRLLENIAATLSMKLNLIEADDGIETIYSVYKCLAKGLKVSFILSDENMVYLKGSQSALIISNITADKNVNCIPFYIVTTYEDSNTINGFKNSSINEIYTKPMKKSIAEQLLIGIKNKI